MTKPVFEPLQSFIELPTEKMIETSQKFFEDMKRRRTVRSFSDRPVPRKVIENCLLAAGRAPSGANFQPWHFAVVSDPSIKKKIREGAEVEEKEFYEHRAPPEWLKALEHLGTDENKPYLERAPFLIVIFSRNYSERDGKRQKHYYAIESVGLACGMLITGLHLSGLVTLTHTPSPMGFLNDILGRPKNEKPFMILVAGYPDDNVEVPKLTKKSLGEIASFH